MRVIGREEGNEGGPTGRLGHYRARDGSPGEPVGVDLDHPHVGTVVGKRGSGKSYTLGVLAEELARTDGVAPVIVDPMGVFGTLTSEPRPETASVPAEVVEPRVPATALDPRAWCSVLDLDPASAVGTLVWRAAAAADTLAEMREFVAEATVDATARRAAANHLDLAAAWDVFETAEKDEPVADDLASALATGGVTILDLAGLSRAPMNAVVAAVARFLYDARVDGRMDRLPWLLVDEAHAFFGDVAGPELRTLLTRGRQPGVSLVAATQRPTALPDVALSQTDLLIVHRLTSRADREALAATRPTYMTETIEARMPTAPGDAVVIDDATETVNAVRVRERHTPHGGASPTVSAGTETVE